MPRWKAIPINPRRLVPLLAAVLLVTVGAFWLKQHLEYRKERSKAVARVNGDLLYKTDLATLVLPGTPPADSVEMTARFVDSWIKKQLVMHKAEQEVRFDEAELRRKMMDYRYALIAYEFEKEYIREYLDTVVAEAEIKAYFERNHDSFELKQNIVKGIWVQVPANAPKQNQIRSLVRSYSAQNADEIRSYCSRFAVRCELQDSAWVSFEDFIRDTPFRELPDKAGFLRGKRWSEGTENGYLYLIHISNYKISSQPSPLSWVKDQIRGNILNNRKVDLTEKLEKEIYEQARLNNDFEVFNH